jgi:ribonuclease HI
MTFDGAFNEHWAGSVAILTSPTGDKLRYAVQLRFKDTDKCSNNIAEYEGLLAGLRAAVALDVKWLAVQGLSSPCSLL